MNQRCGETFDELEKLSALPPREKIQNADKIVELQHGLVEELYTVCAECIYERSSLPKHLLSAFIQMPAQTLELWLNATIREDNARRKVNPPDGCRYRFRYIDRVKIALRLLWRRSADMKHPHDVCVNARAVAAPRTAGGGKNGR